MGHKNRGPLSPIASKCSSGAIELMDFYTVQNPEDFISGLKENSFHIFGSAFNSKNHLEVIRDSQIHNKKILLIMGSEGSGISDELLNLCDDILCIEKNPKFNKFPSTLIDSLNVSTASAILIESLTRYFPNSET